MNQTAKSRLKRMLSQTKYDAKRRNLEFNLTHDYVFSLLKFQNEKCALTGKEFDYKVGGDYNRRNPDGISIDRINNSIGYIVGNIQLVRCKLNIIKSNLDNNEFIDLCKQVTQNSKKSN
jgi:hypothetical protein